MTDDRKTPSSRLRNLILSSNMTQSAVPNIENSLRTRALLNRSTVPGDPDYPVLVTALPTPVCLQDYRETELLQASLNAVLDKLSLDKDTIVSALEHVSDEFVQNYLKIYKSLPDSHTAKPVLCLNRHDYMLHSDDSSDSEACLYGRGQFKLVEFNLQAVSMTSFSEGVFHHHNSILRQYGIGSENDHARMDTNGGFAKGFLEAYKLYNASQELPPGASPTTFLLMVVDEDRFTFYDQQILMNSAELEGIPTLRVGSRDLVSCYRRDVHTNKLYVHDKEIAIVYYRTFYTPANFPTPEMWTLRAEMELSAAVNVPNVRHTLVNMKLFQMRLSDPGFLARYTGSAEETSRLGLLFHPTLPLDLNPEGDRNAQLGIDHPGEYVLKPQREGGGNNLWDGDMVQELERLSGRVFG